VSGRGFFGGPGFGGPGFGGHGWGGPGFGEHGGGEHGWGGPGGGGHGWGGPGGHGWGGPGWGGPGFGGHSWGGPGSGGHSWGGPGSGGPGWGGHGFGGRRKRVVVGTAALLLDGPANAEQIAQRVSEATDGALTPPEGVVEFAIGLLAGRGFVTVSDGVATLTELGTNVLAWKGISSETIHAKLARVAKFGDVIKIRKGLFELAGLARTIVWTGTDAQKEKLAEARTKVLAAITEAKQSLHSALAES
jgi:DNA-binding PadR family transcriptional regulator